MTKIEGLVSETSEMLRNQPLLRSFNGDTIVAGDIHGDLDSLQRIVKYRNKNEVKNLILLGDYVDRGPQQIEVIREVCELILSDKNFIALRGNHEDYKVCSRYGFIDVLNKAKISHEPFLRLFGNLPLAAHTNDLFFVHGGPPIDLDFKVQTINNIHRRHTIKGDLMLQLLWNDPIFRKIEWKIRYRDSFRGLDCYEFGSDVTETFLRNNNFKMVIRAHSYLSEGFKWLHGNKLLSLFSCNGGPYSQVNRCIALIKNYQVEIVELSKM